ncbi:hypothetical protein CK203_050816 [Vitis vinifera]|uniref:Uncharacterized protein n=1 Tax=Vitis vinifera TaxID=29760 RepID=A0A438HBP2_VITVI|nr:hypothetical protein CK203_050816 [Vitis vinifera]
MAQTRGAKSSFPVGHKRVAREAPVQGSTSEPPRQVAVPLWSNRAVESSGEALSDQASARARRLIPSTAQISHGAFADPRDFFYPRVATDFYQSMTTNQVIDPTLIHFTIDGRHGILGARHIAEALHIPYEPARLEDYRVWTNPPQLEMVHLLSRGTSTNPYLMGAEERSSARGLVQDIRGIFLCPHHLIMATLLYFEEKVHKKKLLRADAIPLLFPRLLCQILEHLGYPSYPQLERRRICRERTHSQLRYQLPGRASTEPIHEGIPSAFPTTHSTPQVIPAALEPSTSAEPMMAMPLSKYRDLCHTLQTLTATQSSLAQEMSAIRSQQE